jgi:uncharacterized protein (DUF488 family)
METSPALSVWSIGHSNKSFEAFLALLEQHDIAVVADVRSAPYSRYAVHFNGPVLKPALEAQGVKYVYLGKQIGGMPKDPSLYDDEGHTRYDLIASSESFKNGIERLMTGIQKYRVAIMCGEENPTGCHRRNLIAPALRAHGIEVLHIRGTGELQTEEDLQLINGEIEVPPDVVQLSLFQQ